MVLDLCLTLPVVQSYTPYRTQQRPLLTTVAVDEYIHVRVLWTPFALTCCEPLGAALLCSSWGVRRVRVTMRVCSGPQPSSSQENQVLLSPVKQSRLEELHRLWDLLLQKTKEKGMRLLQAQKLVQYLRECEDAMDWISDKVRSYHLKVSPVRWSRGVAWSAVVNRGQRWLRPADAL